MRAFDLELALAGNPVVLKNGLKAYVKYRLPEKHRVQSFHKDSQREIFGYCVDEDNIFTEQVGWSASGRHGVDFDTSLDNYDIVGMWEEPVKRSLP